jgi:hypothetical protein
LHQEGYNGLFLLPAEFSPVPFHLHRPGVT